MTELVLPRAGLDELLRGWTGDGALIDALAAVIDDNEWSAADIRRRARLMALTRLRPDLQQLPETAKEWIEALPMVRESERLVSSSVRGGVRWAETARRFGWPPVQYAARHRRRVSDETALTTLAWVSRELSTYITDLAGVAPLLREEIRNPTSALAEAVAAIGEVAPIQPDRSDILSLRGSAAPWPLVARIAQALVRCTNNPVHLAYDLLEPDPGMRQRLFHLCVLGELLRSLRSWGLVFTWRAPIGGSRPGPRLVASDGSGNEWDVWFEAAGARSHYLLPPSAYADAVSAVEGAGFPIGVDIALIQLGHAALMLECKWSANVNYVARDGYHQAVSYAFDARHGIAEHVWSIIVGPEEVVPATSTSDAFLHGSGVVVGSTSVPHLADLVGRFLVACS